MPRDAAFMTETTSTTSISATLTSALGSLHQSLRDEGHISSVVVVGLVAERFQQHGKVVVHHRHDLLGIDSMVVMSEQRP